MGIAQVDAPPGSVELVPAVGPDRLEHLEARFVPGGTGRVQQARPQQGPDHVDEQPVARADHLFGRGDGESPCEDRQVAEDVLFALVEEVVAGVDGGSQGPVPCRLPRPVVGEQVELAVQPGQDRRGRQQVHAGGRQLDGQWQPVEAAAQLADRGGRGVGQLEPGSGRARPLQEQHDRVRGGDDVGCGAVAGNR